MLKLLGTAGSPYFRKCRIILEEKSVPYEPVSQLPFPKTPELLAMHPMGQVPILRDGDLVVPDSSAICAYLERTHPDQPMYPAAAADYAQALFLEEYADTRLNAATIGIWVERVLHDPADETRLRQLLQDELPAALDFVETQAPGDGSALCGGFGIADAAVIAQLCSLHLADTPIDSVRWPKTAAYLARNIARRSVELSLQEL